MTTRRVSIAASAILAHVAQGKWLGASWPRYVRGLPSRIRQGELDRAWDLARARSARRGWDLRQESQRNFLDDAAEQDAL